MLNAPGATCLTLIHDDLLSNFALNFNLRRYPAVWPLIAVGVAGRGFDSSKFHFNLKRLSH
jgi:hypothetical protein